MDHPQRRWFPFDNELLLEVHENFAVEFKNDILPGIYAEVMLGQIGIGAFGFARFCPGNNLQ